jgi:WS/DGAT/MGAT family acyltransferase
MRRMTGLDAQFIYGESPTTPMHTLKISILEPDASGAVGLEALKDGVRASLHRLTPFRWQMVPTPFGLHHPLWIEVGELDMDYHVRRVAAPAPGGDREFCEVVSQIATTTLDRSKPLWQIHQVEGLAGGRTATVAKIHHAIADGVSSAELLLEVYSPRGVEGAGSARVEHLPLAEKVPSKWGLLGLALRDHVRNISRNLPSLIRAARIAKARRKAEVDGVDDQHLVPKMYQGPKTPINGPLTRQRSFAFFTVPLDDARVVAKRFGVTVNDVFLSSVAGGLRLYLEKLGALPEVPLVGSMPASTRTEEQRGTWGNQLAMLYTHIATHKADAIERLRASHEASAAAKRELDVSKGARPEDWLELYPPGILRAIMRLGSVAIRAGGPAPANLVVSNVRGPDEQLYSGEIPLENFISVGPPIQGAGLNITAWSYAGKLNFTFIACQGLVPDIWNVVDLVRLAFEELQHLADREGAKSA